MTIGRKQMSHEKVYVFAKYFHSFFSTLLLCHCSDKNWETCLGFSLVC